MLGGETKGRPSGLAPLGLGWAPDELLPPTLCCMPRTPEETARSAKGERRLMHLGRDILGRSRSHRTRPRTFPASGFQLPADGSAFLLPVWQVEMLYDALMC